MGTLSHHPRAGAPVRRAVVAAASGLIAVSFAATPAGARNHTRDGRKHHHARAARFAHPCAHGNTASVDARTKAMQRTVLCLINNQRFAHGLPALRDSWRLDRSAQGWSNRMVATQSFTHGPDFATRISAVGFSWSAAGENIATGYPTPQAVVSAWMASTGHCENILNPTYRSAGMGLSRHGVPPYGTGPSTWTEDFGLRRGASAPSGNWGPALGCPY